MQINTTEYYSHTLNETLLIEVTGHYGYPILMFPTSQGSYKQNADFHLNTSIADLINDGKVKLYNIQTLDNKNFYAKNIHPSQRINNYEKYVQFLVLEYIPYLQQLHSTHHIAVAGCSFGGYHAANLAFRFPNLISHLICLSGAFSIRNFMDDYDDVLIYFNSPEEFLPNDEAWRYRHMQIVLSTSDQDVCLPKVKNMAEILTQKEINFWYDEAKWITHDWPLWRMSFPKYMNAFFNY